MRAGFAFLQDHTEIDPNRIGLMGFSNGSWVASLAAQDLPNVAFLSVSMASAVSQITAERYRREAVLRSIGVSEEARTLAVHALDIYFRGAVEGFSDADAAEFSLLYDAILANPELQAATGFRVLPTEEPLDQILAAGGSLAWMDYAPVQTYLAIEAPVAFYIGELDENIPPDLSIAAMRDVIGQRPDADVSLRVYHGASHGLYIIPSDVQGISQDVLHPNLASYEFAPEYIEDLRAWIRAQAEAPNAN